MFFFFLSGTGAGRQAAGDVPRRHGRPLTSSIACPAAGQETRRHLGRTRHRGRCHELRQEGRAEGLQDDGGPLEGHRQERAVLAPGREREDGHLRRHVPGDVSSGGSHHPAGRRGG